jgi:hypothetical protein
MRTIRTKVYQFSELSKAAKLKALRNYARFNNPKKKSDQELIVILQKPCFTFVSNGEIFNGLTN